MFKTIKKFEFSCLLIAVNFLFVTLGAAQSLNTIPFVVYNSEKVFRNSELGQEIIRSYNKTVQKQFKEAKIAAKEFEDEEQSLVQRRKELSVEEFKILADDFDERVRETRISHKKRDEEIRELYGIWKENFFNETIPRAFEPISKEYNVFVALDLSASKNLVYRENIEVTELFITQINQLYNENRDIFDLITLGSIER